MTKQATDYQPSKRILERYAEVLVRFAPNNGLGLRTGEVVLLRGSEAVRPLLIAVRDEVIRAGGTVILDYRLDGANRAIYELSSEEQLLTYHQAYSEGLAEQVDHLLAIHGTHYPQELKGVDPHRLMLPLEPFAKFRKLMDAKEARGEFSWTIADYGTPERAAEAGLTTQEYWRQIVRACYLDDPDPVRRWRQADREIARVVAWLDGLQIERLHLEAEGTDLWVTIGRGRQWIGGGGKNIPSFEIFTSPDWRGTQGVVSFSEPLYYQSNLIEGIRLVFEGGVVTKATATRGQKLLRQMLATDPGSSRLGEFSLTDRRLSRVTRYMASTLYDENRGGRQGNVHMAVGFVIDETYVGPGKLTDSRRERLGFNRSRVHTDIISTTRRRVSATLADGSEKVIYQDGEFTV